ncbi:MAG: TraB/GumN family protein [Treponema sp.]|jgi:pheromone shutdown-related protein TraB|nr:TraB/GumN family protein [Treponema sp.]
MNDTRKTCSVGGREITLIGTAHVSRDSIDEVGGAIRNERPDMVCVELDQDRMDSITQKDAWEKLDVAKVFREGKGFLLLANLVLAGFQRRMGDELGVKPGEEMKAAVETARELGIPYALCDREVQITLRRAWSSCGLWSKSKLMASLLSSAFVTEKLSEAEIEHLKSRSELDGMMNELAAYLPSVKETLIDERDRYLAAKIWAAGGVRVIAVVGAGHLAGIASHLEKIASGEADTDVEPYNKIPPPGIFSRIIPWLIPAALAVLVGFGIWRLGVIEGLSMLRQWVLWNGSLAALGSVLALGHPLSWLASFIGAPIATVNPFIGVGLFSGLAQVYACKPRVEDAETLREISNLRGFYRNRITRALLVFLLSSIGGIVGNAISIPSLAGVLLK